MSTPLVIAVIGFVLVNIVGLALSRTWLRFAIFYLVDVAIFVGVSAAIILNAPYLEEGWQGRTRVFSGYQVADSEASVIALGAVWLFLMLLGASFLFVLRKIPAEWFDEDSGATARDDP